MKSISLRKLECLSNEYNYRESVIKNPPESERNLAKWKPLRPNDTL